jgi:ATP/maltotriose-dependent transcriptional regulator MalT
MATALAETARATLCNGLGRHDEAMAAAQRACEYDDLGLVGFALIELVEAAARAGHPGVARAGFARLEQRTRVAGTDWARGVEAWSRAHLTEGDQAGDLLREAVDRLARTRVATHLARAQLRYGEWLRRAERPSEARHQLRAAHEAFLRMGAEGFASLTRKELVTAGDTAPANPVEGGQGLSVQEAQIARLAVAGLTNPEIGAELFISARTVEWHLHKVFTKLAITSRRELRGALTAVGIAAS